MYLAHVGASDGLYHTFSTNQNVVGTVSSASGTPSLVEELQNIQRTAQNDIFDSDAFSFIDFSESNPFGDPI